MQHPCHDGFEQVLTPPDVAVETHRFDAELLAEIAHRQLRGAVLIDELDGRPHDEVTAQPLDELDRDSVDAIFLTDLAWTGKKVCHASVS
ncbi:hypothetical protein GCM10027613_20820 [Microlunatus endophyticus]